MSLAPIIDREYRLHPQDLQRGPVRVTIQNVSWQGLEQASPVLHLREFTQKRLPLDRTQCQALIAMTGTTLYQEWIGHSLILYTAEEADGLRIVLHPANQPLTLPLRTRLSLGAGALRPLLLALLLILLFLLALIVERL
ncbi:MAG: hypothetical protein R3C14_22185 [Caldilineaceae bacterium]